MTNPKGTVAETLLTRYARLNGFPFADRQPKRGIRDSGDVTLCPGIVVEVKNYTLPKGFPTAGQLSAWMGQSAVEAMHAHADHCLLVVKRPGTTDVARWFTFLTLADFAVITDSFVPRLLDAEPITLTVHAALIMLRAGGYGTPLNSLETEALS